MNEKNAYQKLIDRHKNPKTYRVKGDNQEKLEKRKIEFDLKYPSTGLTTAKILNILIKHKLIEISDEQIINELNKEL